MSFICTSNAALVNAKNKLNDLKDGLNDDIDAAKASIGAKLNSLKDSLLDIKKPSNPTLSKFKDDLYALKGKTGKALIDARNALNEKWGGLVSDLDTLITAVSNPLEPLDFCKDVPNVEGTPGSDGKLVAVTKAQESPTPNEIPEEVKKVTVVTTESEKIPTSSGISEKQSRSDYDGYVAVINETVTPINSEIDRLSGIVSNLASDSAVKKAQGVGTDTVSQFNLSPEDRLRKNLITQTEYAKYKDYRKNLFELQGLNQVRTTLFKSFSDWEYLRAGKGNTQESILDGLDRGSRTNFPSYATYFDKPKTITATYATVIQNYYKTSKKIS